MATLSRRRISRMVGTSCVAATIALSGVGAATAAPPADRAAASPQDPTPPPTPEPPSEPPGTPQPPDTPPPQQNTEPPDTPPPSDPSEPPDSPPPSDPDRTGEPEKPGELKKDVQDSLAHAPHEVRQKVEKALTQMLDLIDDPDTPPAERKAYTSILKGITATLDTLGDPDTPPEDRAAYTKIMKAMSEAVTLTQEQPASGSQEAKPSRTPVVLGLLAASGDALVALQDPGTTPPDPKDRKKIQQIVAEACEAARTIQDPDASAEEKQKAEKVLARRAAVFKNAQYLDLMKEIKQYKARAACVDTVENRTRQAGWADGSLWGLSDPACAASVAAGARQEDSRWHALMACVLRNPFSTCVGHVPGG